MAAPLVAPNRDHLRYLIAYALRHGEAGTLLGVTSEDVCKLTADTILRHIERAGYVVLQEPPAALVPVGSIPQTPPS